ncbi:putative phosphatidate phosphatase [Trichonephila clavata]|uniref:Putative phosphatidate phosphatase n=1 Tax=Trichonephila clavata TaxID=2740835 RepID=A0A8X6FXC9_TRICU|nr:putative phosphatidate phosphatase [Trichonephila clavata]
MDNMPLFTVEEKMVSKIIFDLVLLLIAAIPVPIFYVDILTPFRRGYFCDDETIKYPYKDSTVSDCALYVGGLSAGLISIILCILLKKIRDGSNNEGESEIYVLKWKISSIFFRFYSDLVVFLFGACITEIATNFIKYFLGRLRPNFLDVCQSSFNCSSVQGLYTYVENYTCTNPDIASVNDSRLSFPSGHSSIAMYAMMFSVVYLYKYFSLPCAKLLKPILQFIPILFALYTAISRIEDNKHHWSDVMGGSAIGIVVALSVSLLLGKEKNTSQILPKGNGVFITKNLEIG